MGSGIRQTLKGYEIPRMVPFEAHGATGSVALKGTHKELQTEIASLTVFILVLWCGWLSPLFFSRCFYPCNLSFDPTDVVSIIILLLPVELKARHVALLAFLFELERFLCVSSTKTRTRTEVRARTRSRAWTGRRPIRSQVRRIAAVDAVGPIRRLAVYSTLCRRWEMPMDRRLRRMRQSRLVMRKVNLILLLKKKTEREQSAQDGDMERTDEVEPALFVVIERGSLPLWDRRAEAERGLWR